MQRLFCRLHSEFAGPDSMVAPYPWNTRWQDVAESVRVYSLGSKPQIDIFGYSWGGAGAVRLCEDLAARGLTVRNLVLCDAVHRMWRVSGRWRALVSWSQIWVPENVENVFSVHQRNPRFSIKRWWLGAGMLIEPQGHTILARNSNVTNIRTPIELPSRHSYIDDHETFHEMALKVTRYGH